MLKSSRVIPVIFAVLITLLGLTGCSSDYKAENLASKNDEDGWLCTFDFLSGDYSNGFKINSGTLKIVSSIQTGDMRVFVTGGGETLEFDGRNAEQKITASDFGENGGVLYITLKCDNARGGNVRVIWLSDGETEETEAETKDMEQTS